MEDILRDKLVYGVKNLKIQQRQLAKINFTNNRSLPCAMERAKKYNYEIERGVSGSEKVKGTMNGIQSKWDRFEEIGLKKEQINFCSRGNHFQSQCGFKNAKCHTCVSCVSIKHLKIDIMYRGTGKLKSK